MTVVDINTGSRRALINGAMWAAADQQPKWSAGTGDERLMLLTERLGDVAASHLRGHRPTSDELLKLLGVAAGWLEHIEQRGQA